MQSLPVLTDRMHRFRRERILIQETPSAIPQSGDSFSGDPFSRPPPSFLGGVCAEEFIGSRRERERQRSSDYESCEAPVSGEEYRGISRLPTISSASKFTPSPIKMVLAERNDPARASVSFNLCDVVIEYSDTEPPDTNWSAPNSRLPRTRPTDSPRRSMPRPQFLHYKSNPKIEGLLNREKDIVVGEAKRLDSSFEMESESFWYNIEEEGLFDESHRKG